MKFALALMVALIATPAFGQRVNLPDDSHKLTVTVFANSTAEANAFLNRHPEIARYKAGNHYNVYTQSNPMTKARFGNQTHLSAYVSYPNGQTVATAKDTTCPLRWLKKKHQGKQEQQVDQGGVEGDDEEADSDEAAPESAPLWLLALAAVLGSASGVAIMFRKELKAK